MSREVRRFNISKLKDDVDNHAKRMNNFITHQDLKQLKLDLLDSVQVNAKQTQDIKELFDQLHWLHGTVTNASNLASPEVIGNLKTQVDKIEQNQMNMKRIQESLKQSSVKASDNIRKVITQMAGLESRVDNSGLDKIGGKIDKMQTANDERFAMVTRQVERKAERQDIMGIDRRITEQLHEINVNIEKFVEKDDLIKKLLHMEKQMRKYIEQKSQHLNNQIANNNINHNQLNENPSLDEGGLLTKKPLGLAACLVCDNKIAV